MLLRGGPGATREANVTLQAGGVVLPIACCGGAAAGLHYDTDDELQNRLDMELARQRFLEYLVKPQRESFWEILLRPLDNPYHRHQPYRAVRMAYTFVEDLCGL